MRRRLLTDEEQGAAVVAALTTYAVGDLVRHKKHKYKIARVMRPQSVSGRSVLIQWRTHGHNGLTWWEWPVWVMKINLRPAV